MYTEKGKSKKIFKSEEVILKPCHIVLVKLDTKNVSASYIDNLESDSGSNFSDFVKNNKKSKKRKKYRLPLKDFISDAKRKRKYSGVKRRSRRKNPSDNASKHSNHIPKDEMMKRRRSDSETSSNILVLNLSDSETASNYSDTIPYGYKYLRKSHFHSEISLNSTDSGNHSNFTVSKSKKHKMKPTLEAKTTKQSRRNYSDSDSDYSDLSFKAKRRRRKRSDSETSSNIFVLNYSDTVKCSRLKTSAKYSDLKVKKSSRRKPLDSESSADSSVSIPFAKKSVRKPLDSETSLTSDSEIDSKYCNSTTKSKGDRAKKSLRSKASTYTSSIEKSGGKVKKALGLKTASHPVSKRNRHHKFLDSETSSNCSDSFSKRKRSKQQKLLSSETSSDSSDSISQFKTKAKHLETEISHDLSNFETDSNFSVSTVRISHADKLSHCIPCKVLLIKLNPSETNIMIHDKKINQDCETSKDEKNEPEMAVRFEFAKNTDLQEDSSTKDILESVISLEDLKESINTLDRKETNEKSASSLSNGSVRDHCIQCHTKFSNLRASYDHTCSGKQEKGYLCQYCEKIFPTCISLRIHGRIHKSVIAS